MSPVISCSTLKPNKLCIVLSEWSCHKIERIFFFSICLWLSSHEMLYIQACMYVPVCMYVCMYSMYACMYIHYIFIKRKRFVQIEMRSERIWDCNLSFTAEQLLCSLVSHDHLLVLLFGNSWRSMSSYMLSNANVHPKSQN